MELTPTDVIAGYAAVVSTVALGWEIRRAWRASRPQVQVVLSNALISFPPGGVDWTAQIEVRNRGDQPVRISSAGFEMQDRSGNKIAMVRQPPGRDASGGRRPA